MAYKGVVAGAVLLGLIAGLGCESGWDGGPQVWGTPRVSDVRPLGVGSTVPDAAVRTDNGVEVSLAALTMGQPTVMIFYRGSWCSFCKKQLTELRNFQPEFSEMGYQIIAISPDQPGLLSVMSDKLDLNFTLLSDSEMAASDAFGLSFTLGDKMFNEYRTRYGVDIEKASGESHHKLPVPAGYLIDREGVIRFAHVDQDYSTRVPAAVLLDEARRLGGQ